MKPTLWGFRWNDPNVRWNTTLTPGDPGYVLPPLEHPKTMNNKRKFSFPLSTLLRAGDSLKDAMEDPDYNTAMEERLGDATATPPLVFATAFTGVIASVRTELTNQGGKTGDAGGLTAEQKAAFAEVERLTAGARRTARQAFPGEDVKLRTEFQVGIDEPKDLDSELGRAEITLTATRKYATDMKKKGWLPRDATALETALGKLGGVAIDQDDALADRAQFTAALTRAANALYDDCLAVQNAARLEYPSTQPGTEAARARFKLETFPPRDRSNPDGGTQPPTTPPTTPPASPTPPAP
jgi:hypothetical protein